MGGEGDAATSEDQLNVHSHVVCRQEIGTASGRGLSALGKADVVGAGRGGTGPPEPNPRPL